MGKSSHIFKAGVFALGLTAFILTPVAGVMADDDYDDDDGYNHSYNRHNYNRHNYNRHYYNNRYRYGGGYGNGYYRPRRHGGHGGEVALGILTGGLLFYALTSNNRRSHNNRTVYVQPQPVYARQQPAYIQPAQQRWIAPPTQPQNQYASCLQIREYQTTITVGNQTVPAYGQSCLQPDGSWRLGPAIPEPGN